MKISTTLFSNIANSSELPKVITKLAAKLENKPVLKSNSEFNLLQDLCYWLYIIGKADESREACMLVKDVEKLDDKVSGIFVLYCRILREEGNITDAKLYADKVRDSYGEKQKLLKRLLKGSLLYNDKINAFVSDGNEERANVWRFLQFGRLCFIREVGGSEIFTDETLEAEMNDIKTILPNSLPKPKPAKASTKKKTADTIEDYWKCIIEACVAKDNPNLESVLQKGASASAIEELEKAVGVKLPKYVTDFYTIHNGQVPHSAGIIENEELLSVERMLAEWKIWKGLIDPDSGVKDDWYNEKWIPLTCDGSGNHICIDFAPTNEGNEGQIIRVWHDSAGRELIAQNFKQWLADFVNDMEESD